MDRARILIADDEASIRFVLQHTLEREGYQIDCAENGQEALQKIDNGHYALALLDLNMQPVDGMQVLSSLRQRNESTVVIILTAHSSIESAVDALRLGAFDYLFKPASPDVIRQRVWEGLLQYEQGKRRAQLLEQFEQLRRTMLELDVTEAAQPTLSDQRFLRSGKLVIDRHHRVATMNGRLLDLTTTEFNLLTSLVEAAPQPVDSHRLVLEALNYESEPAEAKGIIKLHIHHLRQKIEPDPSRPRYIKTVWYKGYMWSGE